MCEFVSCQMEQWYKRHSLVQLGLESLYSFTEEYRVNLSSVVNDSSSCTVFKCCVLLPFDNDLVLC